MAVYNFYVNGEATIAAAGLLSLVLTMILNVVLTVNDHIEKRPGRIAIEVLATLLMLRPGILNYRIATMHVADTRTVYLHRTTRYKQCAVVLEGIPQTTVQLYGLLSLLDNSGALQGEQLFLFLSIVSSIFSVALTGLIAHVKYDTEPLNAHTDPTSVGMFTDNNKAGLCAVVGLFSMVSLSDDMHPHHPG